MDDAWIAQHVARYFRQEELNCATTTLKILAEQGDIELDGQVLAAAVGMHGAGGYRAQCGLVEGGLMFLGILGRARGWDDETIIALCHRYAERFEDHFSSLQCRVLRPEGFAPDQPPHLCEGLTCRATAFAVAFIEKIRAERGA